MGLTVSCQRGGMAVHGELAPIGLQCLGGLAGTRFV